MRNTLSIAVMVAILAAGCNKKKTEDPLPAPVLPKKSTYEYLTQKPWYIAEEYVGPSDRTMKQGWRDVKTGQPNCYYDGTITFTRSGKVYYDEGPTKCSSSSRQVDSSTAWFFSESIYGVDSNAIKITGSVTSRFDIVRLDEDVLEVYGPVFLEDSSVHVIYKHR